MPLHYRKEGGLSLTHLFFERFTCFSSAHSNWTCQWSSWRSFHMGVKHTGPIQPPFLHFPLSHPSPLFTSSSTPAITILFSHRLHPAHLRGDCGIWLSVSGLVLLTQCPSVQFIFMQMTGFHFYLRLNKTLHAYIVHFLCPFIC